MENKIKKIELIIDFYSLSEIEINEIKVLLNKYYPAVELIIDNNFIFTNGFNYLDNVSGKFKFPDLKSMDSFYKELKPILEK